MKTVPFFSDEIVLVPHTATLAKHLDKPISLRSFAGENRLALYVTDNGELLARMPSGEFIEGPERVRQ